MEKAKQKHKCKNGSSSDTDLDAEDSWVVVKKQRVTILIPPRSHVKRSATPKPELASEPSKLEAVPPEAVNDKSDKAVEVSNRIPLVDERDKVTTVACNRGNKMPARISTQQMSLPHRLPRKIAETKKEIPEQYRSLKSNKVLGVSKDSKTIKPLNVLHGRRYFLDGSILLNKRLRVSLLEKKLQKAGGLSRWLASIGLGQFVKIFRGNISNYQLVNLTMKKLKDMGADAVGPRRKLMHAIDCICQPYCFGAR